MWKHCIPWDSSTIFPLAHNLQNIQYFLITSVMGYIMLGIVLFLKGIGEYNDLYMPE